jgi:hypothetical protein
VRAALRALALAAEIAKWAKTIKAAKIQPE